MQIALCHFDLMSKGDGINGEFIVKVPGIAATKDVEYMISYVIQK